MRLYRLVKFWSQSLARELLRVEQWREASYLDKAGWYPFKAFEVDREYAARRYALEASRGPTQPEVLAVFEDGWQRTGNSQC